MLLQLLILQLSIVTIHRKFINCEELLNIEHQSKYEATDFDEALHNAGEDISSLKSTDKAIQVSKREPKSRQVFFDTQNVDSTIPNDIVSNDLLDVDTGTPTETRGSEEASRRSTLQDYFGNGDLTYNTEVNEIPDATFIVPEDYDPSIPIPAPAPPTREYKIEVNDGKLARTEFRKDNGEFSYSYSTADGMTRSERGTLVTASTGRMILVLSGSYTYLASDGHRYRVDYVADERGYRTAIVPDYYPDQQFTQFPL